MSILRELEKLIQQVAEQQQPSPPAQRPRAREDIEVLHTNVAEVIEADVIEAEPVHEDVASHVSQHIDTSDMSQHATRLGTEVGQADEKLESHLHQKFDHDVGGLGGRDNMSPAAAAISPSEIAKLLSSPASIRQAVILSEILTRPADRW